jgi:O-antigen/teichoic acid export membrane protein
VPGGTELPARPRLNPFDRQIFGRLGWGAADQAFSSITNFALGISVARTTTPEDFGAFSIAFATYSISFGLARALTSDVLAVRFSAIGTDRRHGTASATGVAIALGAIIGVACLAVGAFVGGPVGNALLVLAPAMPWLLLQDTWRFVFFAAGRPVSAFINDVVWAIVLFPLLALLLLTDRDSVGWFMYAWEVSALVAALFGIWQARLLPDPTQVRRWLRDHRDYIGPFLGEFAALRGASQAVTYAVAGIGGLTAAGAIRGGFILLSPLYVFFLGFRNVIVPEGVRLLERSSGALRSRTALLSFGLGFLAAAWGTILLSLPSSVGATLLGETWPEARHVILPLTFGMVGSGLTIGPAAAVRSLAAMRRSLRTRLAIAALTIVAGAAGVQSAGATGAAWALAAAACAGAGVWWWQFTRALVEHDRRRALAHASLD